MAALEKPNIHCVDSTDISPPGGHYSHVCIAGDSVYISGQLPLGENGKMVSPDDPTLQIAQVLHNLDACLAVAGCSRKHLVQVRVYVQDMDCWPTFNQMYKDWIGEHKPARCVAGVASLHYGAAIEVEATAWLGRSLGQ